MSSQGNNNNIKPDKNLMMASKILDRNSSKNVKNIQDNLNFNEDISNNQIKHFNIPYLSFVYCLYSYLYFQMNL